MTLSKYNRAALIKYRLGQANETLQSAKLLMDNGYSLIGVVNRLYYACFYAASALFVSRGILIKGHRSVAPMLALHFVKTGELNNQWLKHYSNLLRNRMTGDYDEFAEFERDKVSQMFEDSEGFIVTISSLI
ncbi:MAG: HEPN domain-containing protein [Bacteroidales bacterium]|nr:HEPN domain-containing protein [Bacteroidales bacterium]